MSLKQIFRVYATGAHCAFIDVSASSVEEAAKIAGKLKGDVFEVLHLHPEKVQIRKIVLVTEGMEF